MKKKIFILIATITMVLGVAGCGNKDNEKQKEDGVEELEKFSIVLDWYPNAVHSYLYTAIEKGYFAEEGLEVEINFPANSNDGIALPAVGKVDMGIYYLQDTILTAVEEEVPIVSVGAVVQEDLNVVISLEESGIEGAEDLEGKRIGYAGTILSEEIIKAMLENVGLSAGDCEFVDVGFDLLTALTTKQVDATIGNMVNHEVPQLEDNGFEVNYFYPSDFGTPTQYELVLLCGEKLVADNPEKIRRFLRASEKGFTYTQENPEESLEILLNHQNEANFPLVKEVEEASLNLLLPVMETEDGMFLDQEVEVWQNSADWLYERGVLSEQTDVSHLVVDLFQE